MVKPAKPPDDEQAASSLQLLDAGIIRKLKALLKATSLYPQSTMTNADNIQCIQLPIFSCRYSSTLFCDMATQRGNLVMQI